MSPNFGNKKVNRKARSYKIPFYYSPDHVLFAAERSNMKTKILEQFFTKANRSKDKALCL